MIWSRSITRGEMSLSVPKEINLRFSAWRLRQIDRRYALHFEQVMFLVIVLVILLAGDVQTGKARTENSASFLQAGGLLGAESKGD
jgi:hypothetical protein